MGYIYIQNPNDHTAAGSGMNSFLPKILVFSRVPAKKNFFLRASARKIEILLWGPEKLVARAQPANVYDVELS